MKGDFSRWETNAERNLRGVLHQQGRVLLDSDWNDQTRLSLAWQEGAAQDVIGPGVAAVPAHTPEVLRVSEARVVGSDVELKVVPGKVWVNGLAVDLPGEPPDLAAAVTRLASYLQPPIQAPPGFVGDIGAGVRDAVVLEVWRTVLNGFQVPETLIEPALGGPDTTERVQHELRFRLFRLGAEDTCDGILARLEDDFSQKGKLKVILLPSISTGGDCPVEEGGGYVGFEHHLYRIEIAQVSGARPMFKWSQFNGGLVGRGECDLGGVDKKITLTANDQAIKTSGLSSFYLEVVQYDQHRGFWRVTYGADVTLDGDELVVGTERYTEASRPSGRAFFRLWNGIEQVSGYPKAPAGGDPAELRDGIRLEFDVGTGDNYKSGDYWTFMVRAGGLGNSDPLIDDQPPQGVHCQRVPLAILNWDADKRISLAAEDVEDCRQIFPPLTDLPPGCCIAVEPGADLVRLVEKVVEAGGGCLCLLPGEHILRRPINLRRAAHVRIHGFGLASRLIAEEKLLGSAPVFDLRGAADVTFESFTVINRGPAPVFFTSATHDLVVEGMFVAAGFRARSIFELHDLTSRGWRLAGNVFLGRAGLTGLRLSHSTITGNEFAGLQSGIRLSDLMNVVIERNRFLGFPVATAQGLDAIFAEGWAGDGPVRKVLTSLGPRVGAMEKGGLATASTGAALLDGLELAARRDPSSGYVAIHASGLFDVVVVSNRMVGRIGILGEILENGVAEDNKILTTLAGASLGLVHGLRFANNIIGEERSAQIVHLSPRVGLKIQGDAVDCRVEENAFIDVRDAITFESDVDGGKDVLRAVEADLRLMERSADRIKSVEVVKAAKEEVTHLRSETRFLASTYFRLGQSKRTFIEGNLIQADGVGIQWSGTKDILDFRVSRNAFLGCRNGAVLIEPDDRAYYAHLAEPVDTKVRLIDRNRFDVSGVAVRSTIGAVRVEKNDIRIRALRGSFLPMTDFVDLVTAEVLKFNVFSAAVDTKDFGNARLRSKEASLLAGSNPGSVNSKSFVSKADQIIAGRGVATGDVLTDSVFVFSQLALADNAPLLVAGADALLAPMLANLEGFVVNLSGIQNEVADNNLLSKNDGFDGGVVLHLPSGVISGNEVQVGRHGVMVNSMAGQGRYDLTVEGNKVRVTGPPRGDGKRPAAYALALPTLTPGNYAILDNHLDGSVMVGAEPFASSSLFKKDTLDIGKFVLFSHALAFDSSSYFKALSKAGEAAKERSATIINPAILRALLTGLDVDLFDMDPHKSRAVVQFADNRVVRGYVALARSTGGAFWRKEDLEKQAAAAPIIEVNGNVFDYWARVVGRDVILVGNHSQTPILYRVGRDVKEVANIPAPASF